MHEAIQRYQEEILTQTDAAQVAGLTIWRDRGGSAPAKGGLVGSLDGHESESSVAAPGQKEAAGDLLAPVYDWVIEGFDRPDLKRPRRC